MYVTVAFVFQPDEDHQGGFTARCLGLPITTEGDDLTAAQNNAMDALVEFMSAIEAEGIREAVLEQHGVEVCPGEPPGNWIPPQKSVDVGSLVAGIPYKMPQSLAAAV